MRWALRIAAHEWTHHYLAFHPLGRAYYDNGDMTTLNESVADVVGDEIGDLVWRRFFASEEEIAAADAQKAAEAEAKRAAEAREKEEGESEAEAEPPRFDFNAFMRETRERTGRGCSPRAASTRPRPTWKPAASSYRGHGYFFRKINQAYFAFHGSYAVRPGSGSVSPIGGQVTALRDRVRLHRRLPPRRQPLRRLRVLPRRHRPVEGVRLFSLSRIVEVGDGDLAFGKLSHDLQLPAHCFDVGTQAGYVHVRALL